MGPYPTTKKMLLLLLLQWDTLGLSVLASEKAHSVSDDKENCMGSNKKKKTTGVLITYNMYLELCVKYNFLFIITCLIQ